LRKVLFSVLKFVAAMVLSPERFCRTKPGLYQRTFVLTDGVLERPRMRTKLDNNSQLGIILINDFDPTSAQPSQPSAASCMPPASQGVLRLPFRAEPAVCAAHARLLTGHVRPALQPSGEPSAARPPRPSSPSPCNTACRCNGPGLCRYCKCPATARHGRRLGL